MRLDWYFDFISPFAYLQLHQFDRLPEGCEVTLHPIVFGAVLSHWGQLGPAEIPPKRVQTFRHCVWMAGRLGLPLRPPPRHPFNPLPLGRLAIAAGSGRAAVERLFAHVWGEGGEPEAPGAIAALGAEIGVPDAAERVQDPAVKDALRASTEAAIARGVYGVPTFAAGDRLFWGNDVFGMMQDYLADPGLFDRAEYRAIDALPEGQMRKR